MTNNYSDKLKKLIEINKNQPVQRSQEWFELRKNCITASNAASLINKSYENCKEYIEAFPNVFDKYPDFINESAWANPYQDKNDYILQKCGKGKQFQGSVATEWGNKYESVICTFYEQLKNTKVLEFGLLPHPVFDWLKASPDGICENGTMLEIKAPYRRKLNGIIPFYYWIQVQLQLEVADLDICDYIECKITETSKYDYDKSELPKGFFVEEDKKLIHFVNNNNEKDITSVAAKTIYFVIEEYDIISIKREKGWFNRIENILKNEWDMILHHRKTDCKELVGTMYIDHDFEVDTSNNKRVCSIETDTEDEN